MQLPVLRPGNSKLGQWIYQWSITAGKAHSCPGESGLCASRCYAKRGFYNMQSNINSLFRNFEFTQTPEFAGWMTSEIRKLLVRVFRIHVSGDFYSPEYIEHWYSIVERNPRTQFFAYTRSWRLDHLLPHLIKLSNLPNMELWLSCDRETGRVPLLRGMRRAYMAIDDTDARCAFDDCDLVFRDNAKTVMKKANGVQVCPVENGVETKVKITCTSCGICWKGTDRARWEGLLMDDIFYGEGTEISAPALPVVSSTQLPVLAT